MMTFQAGFVADSTRNLLYSISTQRFCLVVDDGSCGEMCFVVVVVLFCFCVFCFSFGFFNLSCCCCCLLLGMSYIQQHPVHFVMSFEILLPERTSQKNPYYARTHTHIH